MTESEAAFVAALITKSLGERQNFLWLGLYDPSQNRRWRWSDNALLTLNAWERGAPRKTTLRFCASLSPHSDSKAMLLLNFSELFFKSLLLIGLAQGLEDLPGPPSARNSCPEGFDFYNFNCYGLIYQEEDWNTAELQCQGYNSGHLLSLFSEAETHMVATMILESGNSQKPFWIGLYDPRQNRRWHWSSNGLLTYLAWDLGAPSRTNPNYCVILTPDSDFTAWKDELCSVKLPFICKFKP
uniref:C-type lectin domain-containing protein n=2 Tax=Monodelphis domestica TaxID=13616 RepID=F6QH47_MONDO